MNTLILLPEDFTGNDRVRIDGRRAQHIRQVLKKNCGDTLRAGIVNGKMGTASITAISADMVEADVSLQQASPDTAAVHLLLALPRPKMLKRMLRTCAELGVEDITLLNAFRVEKSYWQSPLLQAQQLREYCLLGLEQAGHTHLPRIQIEKRFKPFVEDRLPTLLQAMPGFVAHPGSARDSFALDTKQKLLLALGPEGGFIDYEVEKLRAAGCDALDLGRFIMRCDTALPYAMASIAAMRSKH